MRHGPHARPHVVLVGPMGAGKSHVGRLLATRLGLPFVDVDACIQADAGQSIVALFAAEGEPGFRRREAAALRGVLAGAAAVVATGGGAVLDPANRAAMRAAARVVYLQVDPAIQRQRLAGDTSRPLLQDDDPAHRLAALQAQREPLYREVADVVFDGSAHAPDAAADALATLLTTDEGRRA